jgi:hypothetical protein
MGIVAGTFVLESNDDGSSFSNSIFCIITSVGCPLIQPSTLTVDVNFFEFGECNASADPVNSKEPDFFSKSTRDNP